MLRAMREEKVTLMISKAEVDSLRAEVRALKDGGRRQGGQGGQGGSEVEYEHRTQKGVERVERVERLRQCDRKGQVRSVVSSRASGKCVVDPKVQSWLTFFVS